MRKFMYFLCADAAHLQNRLNKLGQKVLELVDTEGLFTGHFEETTRNDLSYLVIPYGKKEHYPHNIDCTPYGWTLVGGFNGMAILKSLPCVEPDRDGMTEKFMQEGCYRQDKLSIGLLQCLLFVYAAVLFLFPVSVPALKDWWFLSYFGVTLPTLRAVVVVALAANILTFRTYLSAWVHGLTPWIVIGVSWLALIVSRLDDRANLVSFILILALLAVTGLASFWNMSKVLSAIACGISVLVLCFGLIFRYMWLSWCIF